MVNILQFSLSFSYTGYKILVYTFLLKMFICVLSLFVSNQVSDADVKILSIMRSLVLILAFRYETCGPGSSVGIATELRAGRSGDRIPVGARFSAPVQTGPEAHPASCTMGTGSFPGVSCGRSVTLTPHPLLVPRSKIEYSYTSTLPKGIRGLWKGETYLDTKHFCLKIY